MKIADRKTKVKTQNSKENNVSSNTPLTREKACLMENNSKLHVSAIHKNKTRFRGYNDNSSLQKSKLNGSLQNKPHKSKIFLQKSSGFSLLKKKLNLKNPKIKIKSKKKNEGLAKQKSKIAELKVLQPTTGNALNNQKKQDIVKFKKKKRKKLLKPISSPQNKNSRNQRNDSPTFSNILLNYKVTEENYKKARIDVISSRTQLERHLKTENYNKELKNIVKIKHSRNPKNRRGGNSKLTQSTYFDNFQASKKTNNRPRNLNLSTFLQKTLNPISNKRNSQSKVKSVIYPSYLGFNFPLKKLMKKLSKQPSFRVNETNRVKSDLEKTKTVISINNLSKLLKKPIREKSVLPNCSLINMDGNKSFKNDWKQLNFDEYPIDLKDIKTVSQLESNNLSMISRNLSLTRNSINKNQVNTPYNVNQNSRASSIRNVVPVKKNAQKIPFKNLYSREALKNMSMMILKDSKIIKQNTNLDKSDVADAEFELNKQSMLDINSERAILTNKDQNQKEIRKSCILISNKQKILNQQILQNKNIERSNSHHPSSVTDFLDGRKKKSVEPSIFRDKNKTSVNACTNLAAVLAKEEKKMDRLMKRKRSESLFKNKGDVEENDLQHKEVNNKCSDPKKIQQTMCSSIEINKDSLNKKKSITLESNCHHKLKKIFFLNYL